MEQHETSYVKCQVYSWAWLHLPQLVQEEDRAITASRERDAPTRRRRQEGRISWGQTESKWGAQLHNSVIGAAGWK